MTFCVQCGRKLKDSAKFCSGCGTPIDKTSDENSPSICQDCGAVLEESATFCDACGRECSSQNMVSSAMLSRTQSNSPTEIIESNSVDTTEYLRRVVELEKYVYMQNQSIEGIINKMGQLGISGVFRRPNQPSQYEKNLFSGYTSFAGGGLVVGFLIWLFTNVGFLGSMGIGQGIVLILCAIFNWLDMSSVNEEREEGYRLEMEAYNRAVADDKRRVETEKKEKDELYNTMKKMESLRNETQSVLQRYYDKNIITPQYRHMVAVCSFYEYFMTGECDRLTGPFGAYAVFNNRELLGKICTKLDDIISNLEQIRENQFMLHSAIQEGNAISQKILKEAIVQSRYAEKTAENSELAAHYAEIAAKNSEANAWIGIANYERTGELSRKIGELSC